MLTCAVGIIGKCVSDHRNSYECPSQVGTFGTRVAESLSLYDAQTSFWCPCSSQNPTCRSTKCIQDDPEHLHHVYSNSTSNKSYSHLGAAAPACRPHLCRLITGEGRAQRQENPGKPTGSLNINELLLTRESPEHLPFLSSPLLCSFV